MSFNPLKVCFHQCCELFGKLDEIVMAFGPPSANDCVNGPLTVGVYGEVLPPLLMCIKEGFNNSNDFSSIVGSHCSSSACDVGSVRSDRPICFLPLVAFFVASSPTCWCVFCASAPCS